MHPVYTKMQVGTSPFNAGELLWLDYDEITKPVSALIGTAGEMLKLLADRFVGVAAQNFHPDVHYFDCPDGWVEVITSGTVDMPYIRGEPRIGKYVIPHIDRMPPPHQLSEVYALARVHPATVDISDSPEFAIGRVVQSHSHQNRHARVRIRAAVFSTDFGIGRDNVLQK